MRMPGDWGWDATWAEVEYRTEELRRAGGANRAGKRRSAVGTTGTARTRARRAEPPCQDAGSAGSAGRVRRGRLGRGR